MKRKIRTARALGTALAIVATMSITSCQTQDNSANTKLIEKSEQGQTIAKARLAKITRVFQSIRDELIDIINSVLKTDYFMIQDDASFSSDLRANETDMNNIFNKVREQFGFIIPVESREQIRTFGNLVDYVNNHNVSIPPLPDNPNPLILEKLQEIINEKMDIPISLICLHSNIKTDFGMDSLDYVEFIMAVEDEFGITISDEYAARMKTVGDYLAYIQSLS